MIAVVIVDVKHKAVDQGFDYSIPARLEPLITTGQRVEVPFGTRTISGIVVEIKQTSTIKNLKEIRRILDVERVFSDEHLAIANTLSERYATPRSTYLEAMLPPGMRMTYEKQLMLKQADRLPESLIPLFDKKPLIKMSDALDPYLPSIRQALEDGAIESFTDVRQKSQPLTETYVTLKQAQPVRGKKQAAIIDYLKNIDLIKQQDLLTETKSQIPTLKSLLDKGIIEVISKEKYRERQTLVAIKDRNITLNQEQSLAYETILASLNRHAVFLLHGITSSGKTEIYIKLAEAVLARGKTVLMLVPEISLTPALTARFRAKFKDVAVYHSRLTSGEQYDAWRMTRRKETRILIGARSAVFAPLQSPGLIIIDEEHSDAYNQEDTPRYHGRDLAIERARQHNIPIVLGSATPSIESYYHATTGTYTCLKLKNRALDSVLPSIEIVDMRNEFLQGNTTIFSKRLHQAMKNRIDRNEQTLLLINRRGHANFVLCRSCGQTIDCHACDVTMTYHHHKKQLSCHYCDGSRPMPETCPHCGSKHIRYMGIGSERVEQDLQNLFADAKIYRMDKDTTTAKNAHEQILHDFENDGDFLVGTQMISKGLDFERVTLVGVLSADMSLFVPDYHAKEETFSLLTQMAGRSGRRQIKGEVVIQAYNATHPVLEDVTRNDYEHFYNNEIALRKKAMLPPFVKMLTLTFSHRTQNQAHLIATECIRALRRTLSKDARLIGPSKPSLVRLKNVYRRHVIVKYQDEPNLLSVINDFVNKLDLKAYGVIINHHPTML